MENQSWKDKLEQVRAHGKQPVVEQVNEDTLTEHEIEAAT